MGTCDILKEEYLKEIEAMINEYRHNSAELRKEGSDDGAILENIKLNVCDIFFKMFNISYNKSCKNSDDEKTKLNNLSDTYLAFFEKIPAPWKEKMLKDKEFNMMKEYYIEEIKLDTADKMKKLFMEYYDRYCEEV